MTNLGIKHDRLLGIWNLDKSLMSIGDLLILLADLKVLADDAVSYYRIDLAVVGDFASIVGVDKTSGGWFVVSSDDEVDSPLIEMILGIENVERCCFFNSINSFKEYLSETNHQYRIFPEVTADGKIEYEYGFTNSIRAYFEKTGKFPQISCKQEHLEWAQNFLDIHCGGRIPIALHLKNTIRKSGKADWYNARFQFWVPFLKNAEKYENIVFIVVGNEAVPEEIKQIPNTVVSLEHGASLIRDLALIQKSSAFMGVASGPCNMAVFGSDPYVIFKTPGHHQEWVDSEIEDSGRLKFAGDSQRFLIQTESLESLQKEFERINSCLKLKTASKN